MFREILKKKTKHFMFDKKSKYLFVIIMALCVIIGIFSLTYQNVYGDSNGYALGSNSRGIVPGTVSGNAPIWPITHPVFVVRLYDSEKGMETSKNAYDEMVRTIQTVIPYADSDAMWLCSNKLSQYLIDKKFHTDTQVYIARKESLYSTELFLSGGIDNAETRGRIKYLSENVYKSFDGDINNGVFYKDILALYISCNQNMNSLLNHSEFQKYIKTPTQEQKEHSLELWSYITDAGEKGSDKDGWTYDINIKSRIDQFLHCKELIDKGLDFNNWSETSINEYKSKSITLGDSFNLRYLDLLMTLNAISNNKEYWTKGIKSYMTDNKGAANISITQGIVGRFESISVDGGVVKPATVFVSGNDLTQDAYRITAANNLSDLTGSKTVYSEAKSRNYITRLKAAVSLSKSKTYYTDTIYSSALISRLIKERVRSVENRKLIWGDSYNPLNMISLTSFEFKDVTWQGTNWVLEPPISTSLAVNYKAMIKGDSKNSNIINKKTTSFYTESKREIELVKYYPDILTRYQKTVVTDDDINIQLTLKASPETSKSTSGAIDEWNKLIKKNNISEFRIMIELFRNQNGTSFTSIPIGDRAFPQKKGKEWCTSKWVYVTEKELLKMLKEEKPIAQWKDNTIDTLDVTDKINEEVIYDARVYIQYKASNDKWYFTTGISNDKSDDIFASVNKGESIDEVKETNELQYIYIWDSIPIPKYDYPEATWTSEEPALAYSELKEGSIYNETFEAMAGVPSTRTLYFSSGGNEFMVDLQVDYEHDSTAIREYISHFHGIECEYKSNDQLKGGVEGYTIPMTFVGDKTGKTISTGIEAESSNIVNPDGNPSKNITVSDHNSATTLWAEWKGSINNRTQEPANIGKFDPGKPGSTCAGLGFDKGQLRTKAEPKTDWDIDAYKTALSQAIKWAQDMEKTNGTYTVQKIADSDGHIRQYLVGDAEISININGGDNSHSHTTTRSYSGGTYTSGSASAANLTSSDKGKLGSGWGWTDGQYGVGGGYVVGNHGHGGVCPGNDKLISAAQYDKDGKKIADAVYGPCGVEHNCGFYNPAIDITQGASTTIDFTITVKFKNGTLKAVNSDGNSSDVNLSNKSGLTSLPAHALCGPCCSHDLPAIEDVWYQETAYDTIQITKSNVYKLEKGYVTDMEEITYDSDKNLIANITRGDPNIFYNIAANNLPSYQDNKLANASKVGRIRYSLQEAQGDKVYYEEMASGELSRTNKCDGLSTVKSPQNPAPLGKKGHELGFASGILYSNGKTAGYGAAAGLNIVTEDFVSDNKVTITTPKNAYGNKIDAKDLLTEEWKRFYTRRTQEVTATVISDMLILQTSSGDQSPVYYEETTKAKAQEDFPSLRALGDAKRELLQSDIDAKWNKMWTNYGTNFSEMKPDGINVGSYNGKYKDTSTKYKGTGKNEKITTRFDEDKEIFATPKDELNLAIVKSNQSFTKPSVQSANLSSPGKAQARMDRVTELRLLVDKVKQKPTNENALYGTGESFVFYIPILKYKAAPVPSDGAAVGKAIKDVFTEADNEVLTEAGYNLGPGLTYHSKYSSYEGSTDDKVNDIVVLNAVSTQNAMVVKSSVEDQRTTEGIVKDAMDTLKALEKCPGTPELCEYRTLSCKYTLDTTSLTFAFEDDIVTKADNDEEDLYASYDGQLITNSIKNSDGALPSYALPDAMTVTAGDGTYNGFGSNQFLKVTGTGTKLLLPFNDCRIYRVSSSRVKISADVYIPSRPTSSTMLFSIGEVGLYIPANSNSPVFITGEGKTRAGINTDIIGKKIKLVVTFSLGSLYDCELAIDGIQVINRVTSGLTDAQVAEGAITSEMLGSGVHIGCWEYNNSYATNFYMDNLVITRCGGTLEHSASCYTTYRKERSFYQDTFNGLTSVNNTIDWTRVFDDGTSYGVITNYSKHVHNASCFTRDSFGYQTAIAEAKEGNWTSLRKELGTTLFDKVVNNFNIDVNGGGSGNYKSGDVLTYDYTGNVQAVSLPKGTYKLEGYGAQGGDSGEKGGHGGYSAGTISLPQKTTLYFQVGGKGTSNIAGSSGGYNGGGNASANGYGGGGGATSISTVTGVLSAVLQNPATKSNVILVAGGGGGAGNNQTSSGSYGYWYHDTGCTYQGETHYTTSSSTCSNCGHSCGYFMGWNSTTYYVGAGGTGGGTAGGNGGTNYNATYNGLGGSSSSYFALGQGQVLSGGGGGGGYYGGYSSKSYAGAGGGSGYISSQLAGTTLLNGSRAGNGKITITVIEAYNFPDDTDLFNYIKSNMNLIPDKVTTDRVTITNPIWNCKLINNTEKSYLEETLLTCSEPHHSGGHYDYANDICWSACGKDHNHIATKQEVINANGAKVEQAEYITLDNFFKVYFPNTGDFFGDGAYGIIEPSINRGMGYNQNMDTTEWSREKYVKFDYDVLYERKGVWESHTAGNWIPLEIIDSSTTSNHILSGGMNLYYQGATYAFDRAKRLMSCNGKSTTLLDNEYMAVMNGYIFQLNADGTVSVSSPYTEYNFYCVLANEEASCIEVQYAVESINYDEQSTDATPYAGDNEFQEEYSIYRYGNLYNTNKQRFSNLTSNQTAGKLAYIDIVGRIGNFIIEDTDDMRFSNFFKKSVVESNDDWYIEGIISKVDSSISENYLSWHRNSAGYPLAVDVRGEQVSKESGFYNTWGTQSWTVKANSESLGVSADKNADIVLQKEQLKLGYNVFFDITTLGNYNQYLQAIPYFYALNTKTSELIPVDVYINDDGTPKPINYFGLYSEYMDDDGNYLEGYETLSNNLYKYNMYLNWTNESTRRNYAADGLEAKVTDQVRDYFTEPIFDSAGDISGYKYLTVPYGNFYNLGTMQCLQPGKRARTFVGNSEVTAIKQQSSRLGITLNGINGGIETNINRDYLPEMFYRQAQRWHLTMGLPSSAIFTAYREKGVHVSPDDEWYVASYDEEGIAKTKRFSKTYLHANFSNKEYVIGTTFTLADTTYTVTEKYNAGKEFNNNEDYVILMTADIKAIGDVWNLKYDAGEDNGNITINGTKYHFGSNLPTFIAAYDTVSSAVDISTQQTH